MKVGLSCAVTLLSVLVLLGCVKTQAETPVVSVNPKYLEEMYRIDNILALDSKVKSAAIREVARSGELMYAESYHRLARGIFRPPASLLPRHKIVETCQELAYGFLLLPEDQLTPDNVDVFLSELWPGHRTRVTVILIESGKLPPDVHERVMFYYNEELDQSD